MSLLISKHEFKHSLKINDYYLHNTCSLYKNRYYYYLIGEVYSCNVESLIDLLVSYDKVKAQSVLGEFSLIVYDAIDDVVLFLNDKSGRDIIYYSMKRGFSVSDDFWSIVHHDNYSLADIDSTELKTQLFFSASTTCKTILNNLNIFGNATFGKYVEEHFSLEKYWIFKLVENTLSTDEKYDALDAALKNSFKYIKNSNPKDTVYGIGVSGGMDSRIIPHYSLMHDMPLKSFIIGQEKPNKFWKSNDHTSSDLVVDYFNLEHTKLEFDELSYEEKNNIDCMNAPACSSQIFKIPNAKKCNFDVLLTGASGFIVGSSPFYSKNRTLNLLDTLFSQQSDLKYKVNFYKYKKGLNYLFGDFFDLKDEIPCEIKGVITADEIKKIRENSQAFFDSMGDVNDTEKLMNYAIGILGQKNKSGAFESIVNQKKTYTPYTPFLLDIVKTWNNDDIYDRKLFEGFIRERLPELANIKQQNHKTALDVKNPTVVQKSASLFMYVLKGQGVMNYNNWAKKRNFRKFVAFELSKYNLISNFIDIDVIYKLFKTNKINSDVLTTCLKMNRMLFLIENIEEQYSGLDRDK